MVSVLYGFHVLNVLNSALLVQNLIGWKQLFISYTHNLHRSIRKRYLKKMEREAKKQ